MSSTVTQFVTQGQKEERCRDTRHSTHCSAGSELQGLCTGVLLSTFYTTVSSDRLMSAQGLDVELWWGFGLCLLHKVLHLTDQALPICQSFCQISGFLQKWARVHSHFQIICLAFTGIGAAKPLQILRIDTSLLAINLTGLRKYKFSFNTMVIIWQEYSSLLCHSWSRLNLFGLCYCTSVIQWKRDWIKQAALEE